MKKLILSGLASLMLTFGAFAEGPFAVYHETSLLNGWNIWVTNGATLWVGETNVVYTTLAGQVVYSLDNITNWTGVNTNVLAPDPFNHPAQLLSDANGNFGAYPVVGSTATNYYISGYNSGLAVHVYMNNTNWIPLVTTNSQGQWYIPTAGTYITNWLWNVGLYNGWPLQSSQWPQYLYPATTNTYPCYTTANVTNTFNFQRGWNVGTAASPIYVWDTNTNLFSFTATTAIGAVPTTVITNLPTTFVTGAQYIRLNSVSNNGGGGSGGQGATFINAVTIGQYAP